MDISKALRFPSEDKDWIVKVLIGGILLLIPVVNFFVFGYLFNILQKAAREGAYEFPAWEGWGNLFGQGFYVFLVYLVYFLIPGILFGIGGGLLGGSFLTGYGFYSWSSPLAGLGILFLVLGSVISLVAILIAPMALTVYAATGEFGQAFNFGEIFSRIGSNTGNYMVAILIYIGFCILIGIIAKIPVLGIISIFASFYVAVAMSYLLGEVYRGNSALTPPAAPPV